MIFVIIIMSMLWLFQIVLLKYFYKNMLISDLNKRSIEILATIETINPLSDLEKNSELLNTIESFSNKYNLSLEILDTSGTSFYKTNSSSNAQSPGLFRAYEDEIVLDAISGNNIRKVVTHPRFGNEFLLIGRPIKSGEVITGVMYLSIPIPPVEDTASIIRQQLLWITLILLIVSIITTYLLSKILTKPVLKIEETAKQIAKGDFKAKVKYSSNDEIGQLASTINLMGDELEKIDQLRKDLISNISHELRTPLSLIRGYAEIIKDISGENKEKREKQLEIIIEETNRLNELVSDILNLSQLQAGIKLNLSTIDVNSLIGSLKSKFEIVSENTKIDFKTQCEEGTYIYADEKRMLQVLINLINNAFNNTEAGGRILLQAIKVGEYVKFIVSDTGVGIDENTLKHIWDRFYRGARAKDKKLIGTGIGLAIVKSILEGHKAEFGVESAVGVGTKFYFIVKISA